MLKRRIPEITGHEAALLVEATKGMLTDSVPMKARRNGRRYVDHSPSDGAKARFRERTG